MDSASEELCRQAYLISQSVGDLVRQACEQEDRLDRTLAAIVLANPLVHFEVAVGQISWRRGEVRHTLRREAGVEGFWRLSPLNFRFSSSDIGWQKLAAALAEAGVTLPPAPPKS